MIYQAKEKIEAIQFTGKNHAECKRFADKFKCGLSLRKKGSVYYLKVTDTDGGWDDYDIEIGEYITHHHDITSNSDYIIPRSKKHFEDDYEECKDCLLDQLKCCRTCANEIAPNCCELDECKWEIRSCL